MPHNGYADQRRIRLEEVVRIAEGRRQTARAAHRLGPKDKKNVGGELRNIHTLDLSVCSGLLAGVVFEVERLV